MPLSLLNYRQFVLLLRCDCIIYTASCVPNASHVIFLAGRWRMMSQGTLLTFFKKTSPPVSAGKKSNGDHLSKKNGSAPKVKNTVPRKPLKNVRANGSATETQDRFSAGQIVWSRMEGHPWWPAMLWPHHATKKLLRGSVPRQECHVQFFGQPPTRGWVPVE